MKIVTKSIELAGRTLTLEVGRYAQQATAAVVARYGDAVVLATVVTRAEETKLDYFPLSIEYQERLYAGGRIKGSRWVKREGRPTDAEILSGRLIDRSIRPLFSQDYKHDVQIMVMVLSVDTENDTDVLGVIAASSAIAISPIPWDGPVSAVRMGLEDGKLIVNPANGNRQDTELDLVVTSTDKLIPMIEAGAKEVPEDKILEALSTGFEANQQVIKLINELVAEVGKDKLPLPQTGLNPQLKNQVEKAAQEQIDEFVTKYAQAEGGGELAFIKMAVSESFPEEQRAQVREIIEHLLHATVRKKILTKKQRPDGRKLDEIRPIEVEVGVLPRVHGSAIFKRGQTQALTVTTLGSPSLSQSLESAEGEETKRYMHHYNFPPFSTGETGRVGSPGRREIGHGALAERALTPVIPAELDFPYAIRVVSEIMSSNGSTSMASTCGSTLSLMDAGVPIKSPVAGISIGLVTPDSYPQKTDEYLLMTDIIGLEDHHTDMDFKVAGTKDGITAIQLDVKVPGLTLEICKDALSQARDARMKILDIMLKAIPAPRPQLSQYAPKITSTQIPVEKIGELIGPGGKIIKKLMADTLTTVDVNDEGMVFISGPDEDGVKRAVAFVEGLAHEVKAGEEYDGIVARIQPFGAFVNILPGKDGLVHVSRMSTGFVGDPNEIVHEGQTVHVRVTEIDDQNRIALTMLTPEEEAAKKEGGNNGDRPRSVGSRPGGFAPNSQPAGGGFFRPAHRNDRHGGSSRGPRR